MIEFFALAFVFFLILLGSNLYHSLLLMRLEKSDSPHLQKQKVIKTNKASPLVLITILFLLIIASLVVVFLLSKNILLVYVGLVTFAMLTISVYFLAASSHRFIISLFISTLLILVQLFFKIPALGNLLIILGYLGVTAYIMQSKILPPKIILVLFIFYALYDLMGVYVIPLQPALADKAINDIFPPAIQIGQTLLGNGDLLFALLMTAFLRVYYGLSTSLTGAFLFSLPLGLLGVFAKLFPWMNITVPYLVLMTPLFLGIVAWHERKA